VIGAAWLLDRLLRASLEGAVLIVLVAAICRLVPSLPARHRAALWWLATAKLLLTLVPMKPLELPLLPPPAPAVSIELPAEATLVRVHPTTSAAVKPPRTDASRIALAWAGGVLALSALALRGAFRTRLLRRRGKPLADPTLQATAAAAAHRLGLARVPPILLVPQLPGPLVVGLVRPAVLMPADAVAALDASELRMAVEHELAHVARRDLWLGLVPAAARRIFFFHPLAWWAEREYAIAREAACDEAVVARGGADAFVYGRLLLRLAAPRPTTSTALSPRSMLRRRLEMIEATVRRKPLHTRVVWVLIAVAAVGLIPLRLVAREAAPPAPTTPAAAPEAETPPAPDVPQPRAPRAATPSTPAAPRTTAPRAPREVIEHACPPSADGERAVIVVTKPNGETQAMCAESRDGKTWVAGEPVPAPRKPRTAPPPPEPAEPTDPPSPPPTPRAHSELQRCLYLDDAGSAAFVITERQGYTMCGEKSDVRAAERARRDGDDLIWFRLDGTTWVIRDPATIAEARELFARHHRIGQQQADLGKVQSEIGARQAEMGQRQAEMALAQARMALDQALAQSGQIAATKMAEMSEHVKEVQRQMGLLDQQQAELSRLQSELSDGMLEDAVESQRRLSLLLKGAMDDGRAERQ
jgi:beta-lactamase regulating signal transducer with metallopeptidase domain